MPYPTIPYPAHELKLGEWGGRNGRADHQWHTAMVDYLTARKIGSFYYCVNANSQAVEYRLSGGKVVVVKWP